MKIGNKYLYTVASKIYLSTCTEIRLNGQMVMFDNGGYIKSKYIIQPKHSEHYHIENVTKLDLSFAEQHSFEYHNPICIPSLNEHIQITTNGKSLYDTCVNHFELLLKEKKEIINELITQFDGEVATLEIAKALKEHGFNAPTHHYWLAISVPYVEKGLYRVKLNARRMNHNKYNEFIYSAPTKNEIIKWLKTIKL